MATLIRREKAQPPAGVEWNIFASSADTKTSAGATNLDFLLDYGNDEVNGAYTEIILEEVERGRDVNGIDTNADGQLSVDEVEKVFLEAHFTAEDRLAEAQMPKFDRFIGPFPCPIGDVFEIPPDTVPQNLFVGHNDQLVPDVRYVLVRPPEIHPDLYTWNEVEGILTIAGDSGMGEVDFEYKLVVRSFETTAVTSTLKFGPFPYPVSDIFEIPETVPQNLFVGQNDLLVPDVRYVLVRPPEIHPDLYTWNEEEGTLRVIGLSGMGEVDFEYKLMVRSFETIAVTATIKFDPYGAVNLTPITSEDDPEKEIYMVPCLFLGTNLFYPVYQFKLVYSPFDECFNPHWHAHTDGNVFAIEVLDRTGIPDNRPFTCGFGKVGEVRFETIPVEIEVFEKFKIDHLPPLPPF